MNIMMRNFQIIICLLSITLSGCKNHYNEMIEWTDTIKIGTEIQIVKKNQPNFIEISWKNPLKIENEIFYEISKIEGNNDILSMSNFLIFIDGKYQGRKSIK
jgi:hypothetical protein